MAKKKLNTKFIVILACSAVGLGVLGTGAYYGATYGSRWINRPGLDALIARGDAAMAVFNYTEAAEAYGTAHTRKRDDLALLTKFADAQDYVVNANREELDKLRAIYLLMLQNDPRSMEALQRLLKLQTDISRGSGDLTTIKSNAETADRILAIDPKHFQARLVSAQGVLEPWLREQRVPQADVDTKLADVEAVLKEDPANAEAVGLLARVNLFKAAVAARDKDNVTADKSLDAALAIARSAHEAHPESSALAMTYARILRIAAASDRRPEKPDEYAKTYEQVIAAAAKAAKPGDVDYVEAKLEGLRLQANRDPKNAEAAYAEFYKEAPNEFAAREAYAERIALDPRRRDEAVGVMQTPITDQPVRAVQSFILQQRKFEAQVKLAQLKLLALETVTDTADREKRLADIDQAYEQVVQKQKELSLPEIASVLRLRGGIQLARRQLVEAVGTLSQAASLASANDSTSEGQQLRTEVLYDLGSAHLELGSTGAARGPLEEVVRRAPNFIPARLKLADALIREQNYAAARIHVDLLAKAFPDNDAIKRLVIASLGDDKAKRRSMFEQLPEKKPSERVAKMQVAAGIAEADEAGRLANAVLADAPGNVQAVTIAVQVALSKSDKTGATQIAERALAANPNDLALLSVCTQLTAQNADDLKESAAQQIAAIKDPFDRAMAQGNFARQENKPDEAIGFFKTAEGLREKDPRPTDLIFQLYVQQRKWPEAQLALDRLTAMNADQTNGLTGKTKFMAAKADAATDTKERDRLFDDAITQARTLTTQYSNVPNSFLLFGQLLQARGLNDQALEQFLIVLDKQPTNIDAIRGAIDTLTRLERHAEAKQYIDKGLALAPDNTFLRSLDTNWQIQHGDPEKAVPPLMTAYQNNPDNPATLLNLGLAYVSIAQVKANKTGTPDKDFYKKAADLFAAGMAKWPNDLRFVGLFSDTQRALGNPTAGEEALKKVVDSEAFKTDPEAAKLLARTYAITGKNDLAETTLSEFMTRSGTEPSDVVQQLAGLYTQQKKFDQAMKTLERKPDDVALQRQRIELLIATGALDRARTETQARLASNPDSPDLNLLAGFIALRGNDIAKAGPYFEKTLAARPNDSAALYYRAQVRLNSVPADIEGALKDLTQVRNTVPNNIEAPLAIIDVYMSRGQTEEAVREAEAAHGKQPTVKQFLLKLVDAYAASQPPRWQEIERLIRDAKAEPAFSQDPDILMTEANMWASRNDGAKAITAAKAAITMAPQNAGLRRQYYVLLNRTLRFRDLLAESEQHVKADPKAGWLHLLRGIAQRRTDQRDAALVSFETALTIASEAGDKAAQDEIVTTIAQEVGVKAALDRLMPRTATDNDARLLAAQMQQQLNDPKASMELVNRVLADGNRISAQQRARALRLLGVAATVVVPPQPAIARDAYLELLKTVPNDIGTLNNLAYIYAMPGPDQDLKAALERAQQAYDLSSQSGGQVSPYIADTFGWALILNNKNEDGVGVLQRAIDSAGQTGGFPELYYHYGEALIRVRRNTEAEQALLTAKSLLDQQEQMNRGADPALREKTEAALERIRTGG